MSISFGFHEILNVPNNLDPARIDLNIHLSCRKEGVLILFLTCFKYLPTPASCFLSLKTAFAEKMFY